MRVLIPWKQENHLQMNCKAYFMNKPGSRYVIMINQPNNKSSNSDQVVTISKFIDETEIVVKFKKYLFEDINMTLSVHQFRIDSRSQKALESS